MKITIFCSALPMLQKSWPFPRWLNKSSVKKSSTKTIPLKKSNLRNTDKARKGKPMPEVGLTIPQRPKCKAATLGSNMLKTRSNTVGISKTQNADRTAHTEHIE